MTRTWLLLVLCAALSAQAGTVYSGAMSGTNEVPPNASTATGFATVTIDGNLMTVDLTWDGLIGGNPAAAHIHCCTDVGTNIGVAVGFVGFPALPSGSYTHVFDLLDPATYTANFRNNFGGGTAAGARDALIAGLAAGRAYSNIHNATFPGGEIRADLGPAEVPEPSTALMLGAGLMAYFAVRSRKK